ncbi:MAG: TAT-variant-translocated molybdopterin oxidoreductase [Verrucomicrobiae bacterium]|nr:TAT-variant-translocated molybdopterin oxidoreductase [Verrucomicrobiae bacterium]
MKRKWHHPSEQEASRIQWRSLGELENTTEFQGWLEREFPQGAQELELDENSRRGFLKLMGASTALAGFGVSCSRPLERLVPYNDHVEWVIPGKALYYSTAKPRLGGLGCDPLVVTTHEGRPTKVDGNRLHPAVGGGSSAFTQASVLDLYDQDRSRGFRKEGKPVARQEFEESFLKPFRESKSGAKLGVLLSESTSPTRKSLLEGLAKSAPGVRFFTYEALASGGAREVASALYGPGVLPVVSLSGARRLLSLDCDFLGHDTVGEDSGAEFAATRNPELKDDMGRLYAVESAFTLTGGQADHRYRLAASQVLPVAALVAKEIGAALGDAALVSLADAVVSRLVPQVYNQPWIKECAADLAASKGKSLVLAGSRQSEEVHTLVAAVNRALGAYGPHISLVNHALPKFESVSALSEAIDKGEVETLVVLNEGDIAFDAPSDLNLADKLSPKAAGAKLKALVHVGNRINETARRATWHVPGGHYLEAWGDHFSLSGVYSVQQPMINPLWGGYSVDRFLLALQQEDDSSGALLGKVKATYAALGGKDWTATLRDGFSKEIKLPAGNFTGDPAAGTSRLAKAPIDDFPHAEGLEVVLTVSSSVYDGRFANNGWLQESPDPITKLTWDNAALISFSTAAELGLEDGDLVEFEVPNTEPELKMQAPVLRSPGHADYAVSLALGYYGDLAQDTASRGVGFNAYPFMTSARPYVVTKVLATKLGRKHELALTAEHYSMEGRAIAREGTVEMLKENASFAQTQGMDHHIPENVSLYKGVNYLEGEVPGGPVVGVMSGHEFRVDPHHQWAMTVDLNTCTGCNACVIACQAENNIPIVGKKQVLAGREMHWIRMDRYFTSPKDKETVSQRGTVFDYISGAESIKDEPGRRKIDDDQVEMIPQPVACQQCESAPCETVCPVNATVHTSDGLNAMTYNRCIGTRYCANNCPYKARRFNYYDYNKRPLAQIELGPLAPAAGNATTSQKLQKNPNVTVRMRGVIEKCTYCVQRLNVAKIAAKAVARDSADVQVKANSVTVACQDACSANAITFGNLKAEGDKIHAAKNNPRNYDLLKYIGTRPRTSYLARIKNPNPKMPGAEFVGTVTSQMH